MVNLYPPGAIFCKHCGYCLHGLPTNVCPECGHSFDPANPKTFRARPPTHRLRWVVRAGVVLLLLAAVPVGYWGWLWWGWKQEQPVIERLRLTATDEGATFGTTVIGPDWVKRWMPEKARFVLVRTKVAHCDSKFITDVDLRGLDNLTELETLALSSTQATDVSLRTMGRLGKLKTLWLSENPKITEAGMQALRESRPGLVVNSVWHAPPPATAAAP